jgi:hypothetical protein
MATENQSQAPSLNEIKGEIADAELTAVSGGDKATPPKPTPKPTTKSTEPYLVVTMNDVIIS